MNKPVENIPMDNFNIENSKNVKQGWQCPICGRILAPFINECPCKGEGPVETEINDTKYIPKNNISFT